jgi:hypothetical protein
MSDLISISPVDLLLKVSASSVGASEHPPNTNAGPYVERVLARTGNAKGDPWCAAQVTDWGVLAVVRSAGCAAIGTWAKAKGVLYEPPSAQVGDIFLVWFPKLKRFGHTGLVIGVNPDGSIESREGNTSGSGSREGWLVADRTRTLNKLDRVVRWVDAMG